MKRKPVDKPGKHEVQGAKEATPSHTNGQGERAAPTQQDKKQGRQQIPHWKDGRRKDSRTAFATLPGQQPRDKPYIRPLPRQSI